MARTGSINLTDPGECLYQVVRSLAGTAGSRLGLAGWVADGQTWGYDPANNQTSHLDNNGLNPAE